MYNIIYYLVLVFLDSFLYGYCFEIRLKGYDTNEGIFKGRFWNRIYLILLPVLKILFDKETRYRIFQKALEIGGAVLVCYLYDWFWLPMAGIVLAHYLMSFDLGYYVLMNQFSLLQTSHQHLQNWYQVGGFISAIEYTFDTWSFVFLGVFGILFLIITGVVI